MPILRAQKVDLVAKLTEELQNSRIALVFAYTALNMKANDTLRTRAFEGGAKVKMISNTLLAIILKNIGKELEIPQKTLALAYGFNDEVVAAKTLVEFAKETETLEVLGGWVDGNFFDASQVKTLATLPNKETLQSQLVGRLNGLIGGLAYSLNFPIQKLAFVMEAVRSAQPAVAEEPKTEEKPVEETPTESASEEPAAETAEQSAPTDEDASANHPVDDGNGRTEATVSAKIDFSADEGASASLTENSDGAQSTEGSTEVPAELADETAAPEGESTEEVKEEN